MGDWEDQPWMSKQGIKSIVNDAINTYKTTDPTYLADLATYYSNYISGAEKAGEM